MAPACKSELEIACLTLAKAATVIAENFLRDGIYAPVSRSGRMFAMNRKIDLEALSAEKGLRVTEQRRIIARVLSEAEDHPHIEALHARVSIIDSTISIATVYRTARLFEEAGLLDRHEFGDGRSRYEAAPETHHDHLIDVESGDIVEFVDPELEGLQRQSPRGLVSGSWITAWNYTELS